MSKIKIICLMLLLPLTGAVAQNRIIDRSTNGWFMYFGNHRISEKWGLHTEYQWRRADIIISWQQSLMRIGVDHYISPSASVTFGYGYIDTWPYGKQPVPYLFTEHRLWQQLILSQTTGLFNIQHRYRLEQRWLESKTLTNLNEYEFKEYIYRNRVRYRVLITIPLFKKEMNDRTFFLAFYDELFVSFGENTAKNIFDQNRIYAAAGYRVNAACNMQLGYMHHTIIKADAIHMEDNPTFQIAFTYNIDFRKK